MMRNYRTSSLPRVIQLFAIVTVSLVAFTSAHADPIVITSGRVTLTSNTPPLDPATITLAGQNFSANVILLNGNFGLSACGQSIGPCTGASLSWSGGGGDLSGSFTLNGMVFLPNLENQLLLTFNSVTFVIPPEFFNAPAIRITAPFTFMGTVGTMTPPQFELLTGEGTVHVFLVNQTIGMTTGFFLDHAEYIFGPRPSALTIEPVPEPMTILLLVSGLVGTAVRVRCGNKGPTK